MVMARPAHCQHKGREAIGLNAVQPTLKSALCLLGQVRNIGEIEGERLGHEQQPGQESRSESEKVHIGFLRGGRNRCRDFHPGLFMKSHRIANWLHQPLLQDGPAACHGSGDEKFHAPGVPDHAAAGAQDLFIVFRWRSFHEAGITICSPACQSNTGIPVLCVNASCAHPASFRGRPVPAKIPSPRTWLPPVACAATAMH